MQDANYAKTSGYAINGEMGWSYASAWAANLVYGGYSDWRLPSARLIGDPSFSFDGSTDNSYNNIRSEIGHLLLDLGNKSAINSAGEPIPDYIYGVRSTFTDPATGREVSFLNLKPMMVWEAEKGVTEIDQRAWFFYTVDGYQGQGWEHNGYGAWPVRDGDVGAVPVPAAVWLFGSGLISLVAAARKRKAQ
jgi:hypothetical protein